MQKHLHPYFCNTFQTLALIIEKDQLNWLVEPLFVCKRCLPRVMFMTITINSIEIIHNGGKKVICIFIHHNPDSIMNELI